MNTVVLFGYCHFFISLIRSLNRPIFSLCIFILFFFFFFTFFFCSSTYCLRNSMTSEDPLFRLHFSDFGGWFVSLLSTQSVLSSDKWGSDAIASSSFLSLPAFKIEVSEVVTGWILGFLCKISCSSFWNAHVFFYQLQTRYYDHLFF